MKTLFTWFLKLTTKDFDQKIKSAKMTSRMIVESTNGSINHFYDMSGNQIRGYHKHIKFNNINNQHPLTKKYQ